MRGVGRRCWQGFGLVVTALVGLAGCSSPNAQLRPPKPPEEYVVPPEEDLRFSQPPEYPKELLNKDNLIQPKNSTGGPGNPGGANGPNGLSVPGAARSGSTPGRGY
jgi:hypothetical protein